MVQVTLGMIVMGQPPLVFSIGLQQPLHAKQENAISVVLLHLLLYPWVSFNVLTYTPLKH
jgi:hypothetical protein